MEFSALVDAWQASQLVTQEYVASLPLWVQIWMKAMAVVLAPSFLLAVRWVEARWIAAGVAYSLLFSSMLNMITGPTLLWGMGHILFWTPVVAYLLQRYLAGNINIQQWYGRWLMLVAAVMVVSLAFDVLDVARYLLA